MNVQIKKIVGGLLLSFIPLFLFSAPKSVYNDSQIEVSRMDEDIVVFPQFPGGEEAMKKYLVIDVLMPAGNTPEWLIDRILYSFVVTSSGEIVDVKLRTPVSKLKGRISKEIVDKAFWLVKNMPKWIPGTRNGNPEDMSYMVSVRINPVYQNDTKRK
ncbi:hypothetical protein [Coprobacter sp.]